MAEKILITGFKPFGSEKENPSQMVVEAFDDTSCGVEVVKAILPVSFAKAGKMIVDFIEDVRPDVVICLEQAGGRNEPSIERIAVNLNDSNKADNDGDIPEERVIVSGGASAYFSSLPIKDIVKNIKTSGLGNKTLWLLDEGHCFRDQLVKFCNLKGARKSKTTYSLGSIETFMRMVEGGMGITFIPELALWQLSDRQMELVRPFALPEPSREIVLVTGKNYLRKTLVNLLVKEICSCLPEWKKNYTQRRFCCL